MLTLMIIWYIIIHCIHIYIYNYIYIYTQCAYTRWLYVCAGYICLTL